MHANGNARSNDAQSRRSPAAPPTGRATAPLPPLLALQRSAGNTAVVQMLRQAGHPWAQEGHQRGADRADQRTEHPVQRSTVHDVLRTPGRPLDHDTRTEMEARLGADFSDVRLHTDPTAQASAAEVGARAYTSGSHVVMGEGGADPHTLAHELAHVIQQRRGPVAGVDTGTGLRVSHPDDPFERAAEAAATRAMQGEAATKSAPVGPGSGAGEVVQRAVGFEFEAQWKVRRVTDSDRSPEAEESHAQQARDYDRRAGGNLLARLDTAAGQQHVRRLFTVHAEQLLAMAAQSEAPLFEWSAVEQSGAGPGQPSSSPVPTDAGLDWWAEARQLDRGGYVQALRETDARLQKKDSPEPPLPGTSLSKRDWVISGDRYRLEADESPQGGSNLEWVTEPLDTRAEVAEVLDSIVKMATDMERRRTDREIPADSIRSHASPDLVVYPDGKPLDFSPQATAGLALGQIDRMVEHLSAPAPAGEKLLFSRDSRTIRTALHSAREQVRDIHGDAPGTDELIGLVTLLRNYAGMSEQMENGGNTKAIAGVLMSRTDFAHNFRQLPEPIREFYQQDPAAFAELVAGPQQDSRVFPRRVERGSAEGRVSKEIRLTWHDWLIGIPQGIDLLKNAAQFTPAEAGHDLQPPGHIDDAAAIHDSLGRYGSMTDTVGPDDAQVTAIVMEFRRIKDGRQTKDLRPLALHVFDLVTAVNAGLPQLPADPPANNLTWTRLGADVLDRLADLLLGCVRKRKDDR